MFSKKCPLCFHYCLNFERNSFKMAVKIKFENSLKIMRFCLLLSGIKTTTNSRNSTIDIFVNSFLYYTNLVVLYTVILGEIVWLFQGIQLGSSFVELSLALPLITISFLGTVKSFNIYLKRDIVREVIDILTDIHPDEITRDISEEKVDEIEQNISEEDKITNESVAILNTMINFLIVVSWSVLIMFCLAPFIAMAFEYFTKGETIIMYPFAVEYWFDVYDTMLWPVLYLHQVVASEYTVYIIMCIISMVPSVDL